MLKHISLCSGIGGLDLAAEWAGIRTVAQCEIDGYASRVLEKNFKGVPNLHDIRTVTNERLRERGIDPSEITVISAGFPCQPYSLAGKGRGDRDERDLWGEVARVLGEVRPRWFVGENTPGLFSRENQRYFRRVLDDLAALGYHVGWGIWGACDVGAPHKRERVFLVAHADGERRGVFGAVERTACGSLGESETKTSLGAGGTRRTAWGGVLSGNLHYTYGKGRGADEPAEHGAVKPLDQERRRDKPCGTNSGSNVVSDAYGIREQQTGGEQQEGRKRACDVRQSLSNAAGDELGLFGRADETAGSARRGNDQRGGAPRHASGEWWEVEPDVGRVAHGVSARVDRLRCLGNAVVPYQAYPIFEAIAEYELTINS